jgi:hypothetical protein
MPLAPLAIVSVALDTYPTDPQVDQEFIPDRWDIQNMGVPMVVFSFDGVNDHGLLMSNALPAGRIRLDGHYSKLWLRLYAAGAAQNVAVMAGSFL